MQPPGHHALDGDYDQRAASDKREGRVEAGITRANISLDSLNKERYAQIARRDRLPDACAASRPPAMRNVTNQINAVAMKGINEDEVGTS